MRISLCLSVLLMSLGANLTHAGSATWKLDPTSSDWNTAANWVDDTVPNGQLDTAHFSVSNLSDISVSGDISIYSMVFEVDASAYHITCQPRAHFTVSTNGVQDYAGIAQTFEVMAADTTDDFTSLAFSSESFVDVNAAITTHGANVAGGANPGFTQFVDLADAGILTLINKGGTVNGAKGGEVDFFNAATANSANIINEAGEAEGALGGTTLFWFSTRGANSTITAEGATISGALGGVTLFRDTCSANFATLIANGGTNGGGGGTIQFTDHAAGGAPSVKVFGNGSLDIGGLATSGLTVGSLEGNGQVLLGSKKVTVGANNLSTTFSGVIQGTGTLTKLGTGTLTLNGANTYTGTTAVTAGALRVSTRTASATGTGAVKVNTGTLGGGGIVAGAVTIGTGNGPGAFLAPGVGASKPTTLTVQSSVTFKADGTYTYKLNSNKAKADQVIANGLSIETGAQFDFSAVANKKLAFGTVFTAISNTSATPISGTFADLADGSTFTAGRNNYQVSYSGGDGNDLTLTVVP